MKIYRKALVIVSALAFSGTLAFASPAMQKEESQAPAKNSQKAPAAQPAVKTHTVEGNITSMSSDSVTIREANGKEVKLALEKDTQREGTLAVGTNVTASYRDHGGKHIANSIKESTVREKPAPKK
jgi:hypothetical protein